MIGRRADSTDVLSVKVSAGAVGRRGRRARPRRYPHLAPPVALLALTVSVVMLLASGAAFTASTYPPTSTFSSLNLDSYIPATVTGTRVSGSVCRVTWTASATPSPPAGLSYTVDDGTATVAGGITALTYDITTPTNITPRIFVSANTWTSTLSRAAPTGCQGVPGAPTAPALTPGDTTLSGSWTAPADSGGVAITGYTLSASPSDGGAASTCTAAGTSCSITGLTNGLTYTVAVTASNSWGTGPASSSATAIPYPALLTAGNARLWLDGADPTTMFQNTAKTIPTTAAGQSVAAWQDKSGAGNDVLAPGSAPTADTTTYSRGTSAVFSSGRYLTRATGFPTNSDYTEFAVYRTTSTACFNNILSGDVGGTHAFYVQNPNGLSVWHNATQVWTGGGAGGAANTAYIGSGTFATGSRAVTVNVNAAPVTSGTVSYENSNAGIQIGAFGGGAGFCGQIAEVSLFNRLLTTAERRAVQEYLGRKWSIAITPQAPVGVAAAAAGGTSATVTWSAPAWNGGAAVTGYTVTAAPGGATCTTSGTSCTVTGLAGNTAYTFTVTATNSAGAGPASASAAATTNAAAPGAPTGLALVPAANQIAASWTAPASDGGSAITSYTATATPTSGSPVICSSATTSCTLTGLINGMSYTVSVTATNAATTGAASATASATPYPSTIMTSARLKLWLDTADSSTVLASSACTGAAATSTIGCIKDKSTQANNFSQATGADQPTVTTVNSRPSVTFDGSSDWLSGSASLLPNGTTASTAFVVGSLTDPTPSSSAYRTVLDWGGTATGAARVIGKVGSSSNAYADTRSSGQTYPGTWPVAAPGIVVAEAATGSLRSGLNGAAYTAAVSYAFNTGTTSARLGRNGFGTSHWYGPVPESIVFTGTLTDPERRVMDEYLARKWGAVITPAAPTSLSATPGDTTASLTWTTPAWDGGSSIVGYTATLVPSDGTLPTVTQGCASSPCTVTGLTNGALYTLTLTANNATGAGPSATTTTLIPRPALLVSANAQIWLDGTDPDGDTAVEGTAENCAVATTCTAASNVLTRWVDKSGRSHHATQATPALAGTFVPATGLVSFSANGYYQAASVGVGPDATAFGVGASAVTPYNTNGWLVGSRSSNGWMLHHNSGNSSTQLLGITSAGYNLQTTNTSPVTPTTAITNPHVWDGWISGAGSQTLNMATDGNVGATVSSATTRVASAVTLTIGADDYDLSARRGNGTIREIIAFDRALTDAERRTIREYLARKWSVIITPQAPTGTTVSLSNTTATVSWTAPAWNGGGAVTSYTATASPGGATCTTSGTSCSITGLSGGTTYTVTVTAANSRGTGPASAASAAFTPIIPMYAWGYGASGRSGVLTNSASTYSATRMPGPESWASISAGQLHSCGITTAGALYCWGGNGYGQLGLGDTTMRWEPVQVSPGTTWAGVSTGYIDTCAITTAGALYCWGYNVDGQIGDGSSGSARTSPTAVTTTGVTTWSTVTLGQYYACGLKTDSTLWCWGYGAAGRLGNGSTANRTTATQVLSGTTFSTVSAGWESACAIKTTGSTLWCWGAGAYGQLGNGASADSTTPVAVSGGATWSAVATGNDVNCAIGTTGALWCWGYGAEGQLGNGATSSSTVPIQENTGSTAWGSLSVFYRSICALRGTGQMYCWGYNGNGTLGDGTGSNRSVPTLSGSSTAWQSISGGQTTLCGIRSDNAIWCQGYGGNGERGENYNSGAGSPTPLLPPSTSWQNGSVGSDGGCGVRSDGTLWCWGVNSNGQAGVGDTSVRTFPTQAGSGTTWASVSVGNTATCAIRIDASLWCWGSTSDKQTGVSGASGTITVPTAGPAGTWASVSVGVNHTCGIKTDGTLWCWGTNDFGQLGQGNTTTSSTPVQVVVSGASTWRSVSAGYKTTCAIQATGTHADGLYCWGSNDAGQVGDGTTTTATSPVRPDSSDWSQVAVGQRAVCGIRTTGGLYCWGKNDYGQNGQGGTANSPTSRTSPTQVGSATTWVQAVAGDAHACATRTDLSVWCWGTNTYGQVGDRTTTTRTTPQQVPGLAASWLESHGQARTTLARP